jgi:hypothetical protein
VHGELVAYIGFMGEGSDFLLGKSADILTKIFDLGVEIGNAVEVQGREFVLTKKSKKFHVGCVSVSVLFD